MGTLIMPDIEIKNETIVPKLKGSFFLWNMAYLQGDKSNDRPADTNITFKTSRLYR